MTSLVINPLYKELVPRPTKNELKILRDSIIRHGLREPIVVNKKKTILDGHSRYDICLDLGLTPKTRIMEFDEDEEENYVIEANLQRRQVTAYSKVEIYHGYYDKIKQKVQESKKRNPDGTIKATVKPQRSVSILADKLRLSQNEVQCGLWLVDNASDKIKVRLRNGTMTINKAFDTLRRVKYKKKSKVTLPQLRYHFSHDDEVITFLNKIEAKYIDDRKKARERREMETSERRPE